MTQSSKKKQKPVIGLIGGIGAGKSFVAKLFASIGCAIIDADQLSHVALRDKEVVRCLCERWGDVIWDMQAKRINRKTLAKLVFEDAKALAFLESKIHPYVHMQRQQLRVAYQKKSTVKAIVEDCPLLFEKGLEDECDVIVFVDSCRENRLCRVAKQRGWTMQDLIAREKNQWELDKKSQRADYIINNDLEELESLQQVRQILSWILQDFH